MIIISDSVPKVVYIAFYKVVFKIGCTEKATSGLFKTCSMMIFLYHFNTFCVKMYAVLCKNIVYLYSLIDVFLRKNLYRMALFLCVGMGKILR